LCIFEHCEAGVRERREAGKRACPPLFSRVVLREVLDRVKGNQVEAAELLGISRTTLRSKLRSLGLVVEKQVGDVEG
jgi:DNA-binding NtrC family response regulator